MSNVTSQRLRPGIISRGYGVKLMAPRLVKPADSPSESGDEPVLLAQRSGCPVVIFPDRVEGGQFLLANTDCDIIICDDGLQHYALKRDLEIVLIDASRGLGNGFLLPAGPLREGRWRLAQADVVLCNGELTDRQLATCSQGSFMLRASAPEPLLSNSPQLAPDMAVQLVSGIGNPQRFLHTVQQLGYRIAGTHWFADHHPFTADDLAQIPTPLLMTEKDAVKCRAFAKTQWYSLPVQAVLPSEVETFIIERVNTLK